MSKVEIPKSFKLFGETINVIITEELEPRTNSLGESHYRYNEIKINSNKNRSPEIMEATLFHEITHMILGKMEEIELAKNEKFVNVLGQLIHQAIKTMEY